MSAGQAEGAGMAAARGPGCTAGILSGEEGWQRGYAILAGVEAALTQNDAYLVRDLRYSSTTRSVSSATEVSDVRLSKVISPCWSRLTRSQTSKTWA